MDQPPNFILMNLRDVHNYSYNELLKVLDQHRVWASMVGDFKIGSKTICNVLRGDKHTGSCCITLIDNNLVLMDFASKEYSGMSCIVYYRKMHPDKSWYQICKDLLSIGGTATIKHKIKPKVSYPIIPIYRPFQRRDREFWEKRGVSKETLNKDNRCLAAKGFTQGNRESYFSDLCYAYRCGEKVKLYFPERTEYRFLGNLGPDDLWHLHKDNTLLVTKSHKDFLVLEPLVNCSLTHIQSENTPPSLTKIYEWECTYDKILIWFDQDHAGIEGAKRLQGLINYKPSEILQPIMDCKDADEYICKHGKTALEKVLRELGI